MGEYFVSVDAVNIDNHEAVAAFLGRRGETVKGTRWDAGAQGYWVELEDVELPDDPKAGKLADLAEVHIGKPCGVFWAVRREKPGQPLKMGYWLKVFGKEVDRWERLEYLGETMRRARYVIRRLK